MKPISKWQISEILIQAWMSGWDRQMVNSMLCHSTGFDFDKIEDCPAGSTGYWVAEIIGQMKVWSKGIPYPPPTILHEAHAKENDGCYWQPTRDEWHKMNTQPGY